ncbi:DNA polymerase III subunit alpha [Streptomyces xinghaiensis]|uniref:DNA polymerase III subunit alpha n=1 Tax=Streptomyces xinghaiensis TaxID=1038928 RepID=UPI000BAF8452|nr:DNA polymerase III subunit alpha [Streptomyces xinghaiensis]
MSGFTHLHAVSGFSLRYGASHPERLAERAAERGMDAVALTDRDTLAGAVRFARACAGAGVRPVFGAGLAVAENVLPPAGRPGRTERRGPGSGPPAPGGADRGTVRRRTPVRGGAFIDESAPRAVFLARDGAAGWAALCRLVSAAHTGESGRPLLDDRGALERSAAGGGLTVLLGPDSEPGRALAAGRPDRAARLLAPWRELYGDALRLEVTHHRRPDEARSATAPGSLRLAARTLGFAAEQGVPAVLTNAVRYADPGQGPVADVLDSARRLVPVDPRRPGSLDSGEGWLKGPREMAETALRVAEAAGFRREAAHRLLAETERTAARCLVDPQDDLGLGTVHFPEPRLVGAGRRTADRVLRSRCAAAMVLRGHDRDRRRWERLEDELRTIERLGFASYFLTVARVVDDTRALGIRVTARGSGAGSLVNHLLGIAHADPVEHGLLMERFLSERRAALPDIDIDVESARRLDVYRAIFDRFGADRVATVAMPETYRVRHAIRDVGTALGMDPAETDRLAKAFPHIRAREARAALSELPELREVAAGHGADERLWGLVEALDGLPRGIAMHPCGVLLSDASMRDRTPVVASAGPDGFPMSQFDKDDVEELGLLKLDVLGVRMQSAMAHAVTEIERETGERLDLDDPGQVAPGDPATYELIRSAETLGCFQIESPGQRDLVGRLQPATFHDLVVDISLFRPGPVAADMVRPFIEARHGRRAPRYPHPDLEPALRETHGVVVFHEQIIQILSVMTGCDRGLADEARRALSVPERQGRVRAWFAGEAAGRGYAPEVVARTWEIVEAFGSYGFCKAHAVAFAVPTYQSAWLKAHHPAAFYAGLLTHDPGMYPKRLLLADARRRGVPILPLDVNRSGAAYRIELVSEEGVREGRKEQRGKETGRTGNSGDTAAAGAAEGAGAVYGIRLALSDVHGISEAETGRIAAGQPYTSLSDLWRRARPGRPVAERLAQVGALDAFGGNRRDLLLHISELYRRQKDPAAHPGQLPLDAADGAGGTGGAGFVTEPAGLPDLDASERTGAELGVLGMDVSRHLMSEHTAFLEELGVVTARRLRAARHGETVLVAGAKASTQTPPIRSGRRIVFTTLDDGTGLADCTFFEDSHADCAHTVFHSWLLLVRGTVERRGARSLTVVGRRAWDLAELAALRKDGGLEAVAARLAAPGSARPGAPGDAGPPAEDGPAGGAGDDGGADDAAGDGGGAGAAGAAGPADGRRIRLANGYEMHPWADLRPAGEGAATGRKLWHSSPGSAGR